MRPVLVTAGATRNPLDAIRYVSAHSSGRTGATIAGALSASGAPTRLLGSAEACLRAPGGVDAEEYTSTRDLMSRMERWVRAHPAGVVVHSAAVGDYEAEPSASKLPSGQAELVLRLRPAPKILDEIRGWSPDVRLVSFKAAPPDTSLEDLEGIARAQLRRTGSDLVFANVIGRLGSRILLVTEHDARPFTERGPAVDALVEALRGWL